MERNSIIKLIQNKQSTLTDNQKKFAKHIVDNIEKIALSNITEISKSSGVSTATINRFCKKMGYAGFYHFKKNLKKILSNEITFSRRIETRTINLPKENNLFYESILNDKKALDALIMNNSVEKFSKAVKLISKANRIYFHASRSSGFSARLFSYYLMQLEDNVVNLINEINYFEKIIDIKSNDLLISINFPLYVKEGIEIVKYVKKRKAKVILISDSRLAPNIEKVDLSFLVEHKTLSFLNNYTATNALLNALITKLVFEKKEKYQKRLDEIYNLVKKSKLWEE